MAAHVIHHVADPFTKTSCGHSIVGRYYSMHTDNVDCLACQNTDTFKALAMEKALTTPALLDFFEVLYPNDLLDPPHAPHLPTEGAAK